MFTLEDFDSEDDIRCVKRIIRDLEEVDGQTIQVYLTKSSRLPLSDYTKLADVGLPTVLWYS